MDAPKATPNAQRQFSYRKRLRAKGLCLRCRAKVKDGPLCDSCTIGRRKYQRKKSNSKKWKPGGRGRPPKMSIGK